MRLLKNTNIDFIGKRKLAAILSAFLILVGVASMIVNKGLALSIDFTGGTIVQLKFTDEITTGEARQILNDFGIENLDITTISSPGSHDDILIKSQLSGSDLRDQLSSAFSNRSFENRRTEQVGPKIGSELRNDAIQSIAVALALILMYIGFRFDFYYAIGSVMALIHDILITLGVFALFQLEVDLVTVAAFLTIVGYSLNDTIVVFDRIRENIKLNAREKLEDTVNRSLNSTLSRTLITSLTTMLVVLILFIGGLETIKDFAFAMIIGIFVGTYSSIFIASPVMILLENRAGRKIAKKK
ncbi:MAG: protein translocase subunit SecF [Candidatus Marinimicrobia bacterium]|nr:protein translocase subunit SecF [Candidatus Neomarinimicrobiota bacterium]